MPVIIQHEAFCLCVAPRYRTTKIRRCPETPSASNAGLPCSGESSAEAQGLRGRKAGVAAYLGRVDVARRSSPIGAAIHGVGVVQRATQPGNAEGKRGPRTQREQWYSSLEGMQA